MDSLKTVVVELMGSMSLREAAAKWHVSHMTLHRILNPCADEPPQVPKRATLWGISDGDWKLYRRLALAAYGIVGDDDQDGVGDTLPDGPPPSETDAQWTQPDKKRRFAAIS